MSKMAPEKVFVTFINNGNVIVGISTRLSDGAQEYIRKDIAAQSTKDTITRIKKLVEEKMSSDLCGQAIVDYGKYLAYDNVIGFLSELEKEYE